MAKKKEETELAIIGVTAEYLRDRLYNIRNQKVLLDTDLAEIYGYETKAFNQQVKNNIEKFDDDFMFRLSDEEVEYLRSNFLTANISTKSRYNPHVFTEQGLYMLMTVLKGPLATEQSKALIRTFKVLKDHVMLNRQLPMERQMLQLSMQVSDATSNIIKIKRDLNIVEENIATAMGELSDVVHKSELADIFSTFGYSNSDSGYLFLNGQIFDADVAYADIYAKADKSIFVIDNFIGPKTLQLLTHSKAGIDIKVYSDNLGKGLTVSEYTDFRKQYSGMNIELYESGGIFHDRYIILDYATDKEKVYLCGSSSKDSGARTTTILEDGDTLKYKALVEQLSANYKLKLK